MSVLIKRGDRNSLKHYGTKRHSGRFPWGSGGTELSEAKDFRQALSSLRASGKSDTEIANEFGLTTTELRANIAISDIQVKQDKINQAVGLKNQGKSSTEIGRIMGINESSVRGLLAPDASRKRNQLEDLANTLKKRVDELEHGLVEVGKGVEHYFGVTKNKFDTALAILKTEGYVVETIQVPTATTNHDTRTRVLAKPGETWSSINQKQGLIEPVKAFSNDGGNTFQIWQEPLRLNPSRLDIVYGDKGGADADGTIYVRPGVKDLSLGGASYAQVRIQVGEGHYIKGMAVMKEGLPAGVDVQFNTNKSNTGNKLDALKPVKAGTEPAERFGAVYRQLTHDSGPNFGKVKSILNIVNDETDWDDWSKSLATQMLSKQKPDFVKRQLDVTLANKKAQLDEILSLTNPVVKKELLKSYADDMDSSAVHLKAAALPRQKTHVILPIKSLKDNEVYAPGYKDGEKLVLIRYPHGGKFEIPEVINNTRNREGTKTIGPNSRSAIGINSNVAKRLSGADYDGDTVVVIPNARGRIQTESPLQKLNGFDPQAEYRGSAGLDSKGKHIPLPGVKIMSNTQTEMGKISNLITDMTIAGATHDELARAVRHSMVVIDAEKHGLDYKRSKIEHGITALVKKYQPGKYGGGAATIISRTKGDVRNIPELKRGTKKEDGGPTDTKTGEPIYVPSGRLSSKKVVDANGNETWIKVPKTTTYAKGSRMPGTFIVDPITGEKRPIKDAYDLVSGPADVPKAMRGTPVERHYAEYSNSVYALANKARLAELNTPDPKVNPSAKQAYAKEVDSLKAKLKVVQENSPRERIAQIAAGVIVKATRDANPDMTSEQIKRAKSRAIRITRERVGAKPQRIQITPREWEAVQNHAVASGTLREILTKTDTDQIRQLAQPKTKLLMQPHNITLAKSLATAGYTRAEIADQLGVSVSTLDRSLD